MSTLPDDAYRELDLGTAGASAKREHERRRTNREAQTRAKHPRVGGFLLAVQDEPQHEAAWAGGGRGEELVARELAKHCAPTVVILHDRRIPGSRANIDHIAVTPSCVWVIDSKRYGGKVSIERPLFGNPKLVINGRNRSKLTDGLERQGPLVKAVVTRVAPGAGVRGALCITGADLPLFSRLTFCGFPLAYPKQLAKILSVDGPLSTELVRLIAAELAHQFPPA